MPPSAPGRRPVLLLGLLLASALAGCGGGFRQATRWDGRRGYDGHGDYGYDLDAPREAAAFEARARRDYPAPGAPDDPWGPYVREAAARFGVPAFLAAYNAGPDRVEGYLNGGMALPDETVGYVAAVGPRIGLPAGFGASAYGGGCCGAGPKAVPAPSDPSDAAYAGGGMTGAEYAATRR